MKKTAKRTIGESLRISIKLPSNVSSYASFSAVLKSAGSDSQKLVSFDKTSIRIDAIDLKKLWLDIEPTQTAKASAGEYSLAVSYSKTDANFLDGDVKIFEAIVFELVERNTFAGINFDAPIEINIGSSEVIAIIINSDFGEAAACPVSSVNTKTGAVVLDADDIEPTDARGWFTSMLANILETVAAWVTEFGAPHLGNKNNPHETDFSNIKGYPAAPAGKVLTDRGTFDYVSAGGASNLPLYASNTDSVAAGYKILQGSPDAVEVIKTITASATTGIVSGEAHLSATPIGVSVIPAGTFEFGYFRAVNSAQGDSFKQVEIFTRSAAGVETSLFMLESSTIDDTALTERVISRTISQSYAVNPAHFLGVRFKFRTTRATNTDLQYIVGGARGWWMRTTLPLKHDDLSDKNANPDFQHITSEEKTQGALPTGMANPSPVSGKDLSTVKKLAQEFDKSRRLIGVYTPVAGTSAIEIKYDMYGNLLSALNIKRLFVDIYAKSTASTVQIGLLRINNVSSLTYKMTGNLNTGILFRNNAEIYMFCSMDFNGILKYSTNVSHSPTILDDATSSSLSYIGINRSISNKTLEQIDLVLGGAGVVFETGSIISIYAI